MELQTTQQESTRGLKAGEIIGVTTTTVTAQSYELNSAPPFGALLHIRGAAGRAGGGSPVAYYALCYSAETGSIESGRRPVAWGRFEDDEDDMYRRQPQLQHVLRTTFEALLVGYEPTGVGDASEDAFSGSVFPVQRVPPRPPRLHAAIYIASPEAVARFNTSLSYLRFVLRAGIPVADDFIAATIERAAAGDRGVLVEAARLVARLLGAEHERVMNILELLDV